MFEQGLITHVAPISFEIRKNMTKATQGVSFHNLVFEDYQLALRSYKLSARIHSHCHELQDDSC